MFQRGVKRTDCAHRAHGSRQAQEKQTFTHSLTHARPAQSLLFIWPYCGTVLGVDRDLQATFKTENNVDIDIRRCSNICRGDLRGPGAVCFECTMLCANCVLQIVELAGYISQTRPEAERAPYVQSIQQKIAVEEGQTPLSGDVERQREVFSAILGNVKGLGEGSERGASSYSLLLPPTLLTQTYTEIEGFFNLLYAHLLTLWPIDSPETKKYLSNLFPIITSSPAESAAKYRMCVS